MWEISQPPSYEKKHTRRRPQKGTPFHREVRCLPPQPQDRPPSLSRGAARGYVRAGCLKAGEKLGLRVTAVSGSSINAMIATLAAALALTLVTPALAAPPQVDPDTLTLEQSVTLALSHSPKLQEARAKVALARLDVRAAHWWNWLIPTVTTHQGFDFLAAQERAAVALSLDLSKFLGEGPREAERARIGLEQAERALGEARGEVITEVTRAFFQLAAGRAAVQVREEAVGQALKLQALQAIKFEHGSSDLAPLLQAQAALARARLDLLRAQQEAKLAELGLLRAIGLPLPP